MEPTNGVQNKAAVMEVLNAALQAVDPYLAVLNALRSQPLVEATTGKVYVIGAGKAGAAMAQAAQDFLGERIAEGLVLVKDEVGMFEEPALSEAKGSKVGNYQPPNLSTFQPSNLQLATRPASHPVPDERGVEGTAHILRIADRAGEDDLVICLISGGGSALLVSPAEGISLDDIQTTTQLLLRSGAAINELNAVRKHLSQVSGGQLVRRASPARVVSLILSDVVGSPLDVIASGPTAPDPTTYGDALAVVEHYGLLERLPASVISRLRKGVSGLNWAKPKNLPETPKPGDPVFDKVSNCVVAGNVVAVEAAASRAGAMGFNTIIMSTYLEGEAREAGTMLAGIAKEIAAHGRPAQRPACVLFGGETTVTVRGSGSGGRNTELALGAALALDGLGPDLAVVSFATDGGDGNSPCAGAIADGTTIDRAKSLGLDARAALANNDSYTFWHSLGDAIITGPTGTNVNDVMAVFAFSQD